MFTGIAGYSLGGLFALYAAYHCDEFRRVASMSGSLWFPDFREYVLSHDFANRPDRIYLSLGDKEAKTRNPVLKTVQEGARDNSRSPVQWSAEKNAGFSTGTPWFQVNENYAQINVAAQEEDPNSLLNFYRKLLRFRKETPVVLWGDYVELLPEDKNLYVYERNHAGRKLLVVCSFTGKQVRFQAPAGIELDEKALVLSNYDMNMVIANGFTTRPYELRVYLF